MKVLTALLMVFGLMFGASFTYPNFKQCFNKNKDSVVYFKNVKAIAVTSHYAVSYQTKTPDAKYIKYDPYLGLYLFYSKKKLHPVKLKDTKSLALGEWLASMSDDSMYIGNFAKRGSGLESFYEHNAKVEPNSMIVCLCCQVYGLGVGDNRFIPTKLIKRFLNAKEIFYGDIGARFAKRGKDIVVMRVDPFYPDNLLKIGDIIKKINGKKVKSLNDVKDVILFSKREDFVTLEFLRKNVLHKSKLKIYKRFGGGVLSDTFLERKGLFFDKDLKIKWINKNSYAQKAGLKIGDRLLQINQKNVKSEDDIKRVLSKVKTKDINLLFDRNDFQFFVKVK